MAKRTKAMTVKRLPDLLWIGKVNEHLKGLDGKMEDGKSWMNNHDKNEQEHYTSITKHMVETNIRLDSLPKIEQHIIGNSKPGLLSRVQDLESSLKIFKTTVYLMGLAITGLVGRLIYNWLVMGAPLK